MSKCKQSKDNNLFKHADKELAIDAFLCWLIQEAEENNKLDGFREKFVRHLLQINNDQVETVKGIEAKKQKDNIDLIFTIKKNEGKEKVIFENKLQGAASSEQLKKYKNEYDNAIKYVFLKLGFIHKKDREVAEKNGYIVKDAYLLHEFLEQFETAHPFIKEFNNYLTDCFIKPQNMMEDYFKKNKICYLAEGAFQQYVMEKIYEQLIKDGFEENDLKFKVGANNSGSPWTQLDFSMKENVYGEGLHEFLFYRIDKRSNMYYLRVCLYSKQSEEEKKRKEKRRDYLREKGQDIKFSNIKPGKVHNNAKYEMEIIIFFFNNNNTLEKVVDESARIARELKKVHQDLP